MGRWRRKKHHYAHAQQQKPKGGSLSKQTSNGSVDEVSLSWDAEDEEGEALNSKAPFRPNDVKLLMDYLQSYRNGAMELHLQSSPENPQVSPSLSLSQTSTELPRSDSMSSSSSSPKPLSAKRLKRRQSRSNSFTAQLQQLQKQQRKQQLIPDIRIGNHFFLALTDELLADPYVLLPHTLSPKERRYVHECCVEVDLFHCGLGFRESRRNVVISIYRDGFEYAHCDLEEPTNLKDFRAYRPWFCRTDDLSPPPPPQQQQPAIIDAAAPFDTMSNESAKTRKRAKKHGQVSLMVEEATHRGQDLIYQLIDQPGDSLRDELDSLNFELLEGADLSAIDPPRIDSGGWMMVDTAEKMKQCVAELMESKPTEIAFDMEMFNKSRYIQLTCLIQLATSTGKEYVIDTLAPGVWDEVGGLAPLFADRNIVKVGHSIGGMDVPSLHRDFGIFVVNAFDTFEAAQTLRLPSCRLDGVCQHYGLKDASTYKHLKSNYQMTDWTRRPMSDDMIRYGLYDVHFLLKLRTLMMRDLTHAEFWDHSVPSLKAERSLVAKALAATLRKIERQEGDVVDSGSVGDSDASFVSDTEDTDGYFTPQESFGLSQGEDGEVEKIQRKPIVEVKELRMHDRLMSVISKSQERCLALWTERAEPHLKNKAFLSMIHKAKQQPSLWTESHMKLYDELVRWRDMVAQEEKCLPGFVCPLEFLVMVASKQPTNDDALRRISYFLPPFLEGSHAVENSYRKQLLDITRASLQTDGSTEAPIVEEYVPKYKRPRIVQVVKETVPKLDVAGSWRMRLAAMVVLGAAVTIALVISGRRRK